MEPLLQVHRTRVLVQRLVTKPEHWHAGNVIRARVLPQGAGSAAWRWTAGGTAKGLELP